MAKKQNNEQNGVLFHREVPKMPDGYYYGDTPNPNLRAFVDAHLKEKPYDPETDDYDVRVFDMPIDSTKATAVYGMHTYWSKKPHDAIRQYIRHYTKPGDVVLDPFSGSGGTAVAALMEGRKAIAIDRSPAATFITKNYCTPIDVSALQTAFDTLKRRVKPEIDRLYETRCDRCGGKAGTAYTVYSQVFRCPKCLEKIALFDCVEVTMESATGKPKQISACPHCYKRGYVEEISTRTERFGAVPVLVGYFCQNGCKPVRGERRHNDSNETKKRFFAEYDVAKISELDGKEIPYWYPRDRMMNAPEDQLRWGVEWRPGRNFRTVDELFTKRSIWALSAIINGIRETSQQPIQDVLMFVVSGFLLNLSKLYKFRNTGGGQPTGNYYMPQISKENEAWAAFQRKYADVAEALRITASALASTDVIVSTQSAERLDQIPASSVDYIFTDPPYAGKYQYGELNFIWESWLGLDTHWHDEEITINEVRGKTEMDWIDSMRRCMSEAYRVLRPGRALSLCYHDTSEGTWEAVQDLMAEAGFIPEESARALYIDTGQKTYNQSQGDKVTRRDLMVTFRKPRIGELARAVQITGDEDSQTFNDLVRTVIRDFLSDNPGSAKDRVFDEVVSRMVRAGQMEAHNFDELLNQVAEEVRESLLDSTRQMGRWYLKESELDAVDSAESAKEDVAARRIRDFISKRLADDPGALGIHYSDIFESYVYTVKDKPRRSLADWLLDYFYKTESGTYRLPQSEEEERIKAEARASGTSRHIKHYLAHLQQGTPVLDRDRPSDATLAEWIRHCKRSGLYEQGKLLYERGGLNLDNLSEEALVDVEEDYQVCARMLARNGGNAKKGKRGG